MASFSCSAKYGKEWKNWILDSTILAAVHYQTYVSSAKNSGRGLMIVLIHGDSVLSKKVFAYDNPTCPVGS